MEKGGVVVEHRVKTQKAPRPGALRPNKSRESEVQLGLGCMVSEPGCMSDSFEPWAQNGSKLEMHISESSSCSSQKWSLLFFFVILLLLP